MCLHQERHQECHFPVGTGGVNIELINNWTGFPFFLISLMSTSHSTKKSSGPYKFIYMEHGDI